jgi:hypothetical protein
MPETLDSYPNIPAINAPNAVGDGFPTAPDPRGDPILIDKIGPDNLSPVMVESMKIIRSVGITRR